jgi:beta-lactamase class A
MKSNERLSTRSPVPLSRRDAVTGVCALLVSHGAQAATASNIAAELAAIRKRIGGRLGVHALDTGSGRRIAFDDESRYAMASTFKVLLAAAVLEQIDRGTVDPEHAVAFGQADMLPHAPVTSQHLARGWMSVRELCAAAVETSDNPAANLLLRLIEGPAGFTRFVRRLGDRHTRLDRLELALNSNLPGDPRDTTTPRAMADSLERVLVGSTLTDASRAQLIRWLRSATTGLDRLRAGLPAAWQAGDKTGTGGNGAVNDVAIAWPPQRPPILITAYLSESTLPGAALSEVHAEIGRLIARVWGV